MLANPSAVALGCVPRTGRQPIRGPGGRPHPGGWRAPGGGVGAQSWPFIPFIGLHGVSVFSGCVENVLFFFLVWAVWPRRGLCAPRPFSTRIRFSFACSHLASPPPNFEPRYTPLSASAPFVRNACPCFTPGSIWNGLGVGGSFPLQRASLPAPSPPSSGGPPEKRLGEGPANCTGEPRKSVAALAVASRRESREAGVFPQDLGVQEAVPYSWQKPRSGTA